MTPASSLYRFPAYGSHSSDPHAEYRAVHGTDATPFDSTRGEKDWEDPSAPDTDESVTYLRLPNFGEPLSLISFSLPGSVARRVNLPGLPSYPKYDPGISFVTTALPGQQPQLVQPNYLSTATQARDMNLLLGGSGISMDIQDSGGAPVNYPASETRRIWVVLHGNTRLNVGLLLENMATAGETSTDQSSGFHLAVGVGSPGHFDLSKPQPVWIPDRIDLGKISNNLPKIAVPVRDLGPGQSLVRGVDQLYIQTAGAIDPNKPGQLPNGFEEQFASLRADVVALKTFFGIK